MWSKPAVLRLLGTGTVIVGAAMLAWDGLVLAGAVLMLLGGCLLWLARETRSRNGS